MSTASRNGITRLFARHMGELRRFVRGKGIDIDAEDLVQEGFMQYTYSRWRSSLKRLTDIRYRKPYCARHTSVSWNLMLGRSPLWVARQHGHSIATMLRAYAAWTDGATESDLELIRRAMSTGTVQAIRVPTPPDTKAVPEKERLRRTISAPDSPLAPTRQQLNVGLITRYLAGERHPHRPASA